MVVHEAGAESVSCASWPTFRRQHPGPVVAWLTWVLAALLIAARRCSARFSESRTEYCSSTAATIRLSRMKLVARKYMA